MRAPIHSVNTNLVLIARALVVGIAYLVMMIDDKWFRVAQRRAGITAEDIAKRLGKDRSLVSRIYVGRQPMKLEEAKIFAEALGQPLDEVLRRAGVADAPTAQALAPGFSDSDAVAWVVSQGEGRKVEATADALGKGPGVDIWRVRSASMALEGIMPGDYVLVDTNAVESVKSGDIVIAQVFDHTRGRLQSIIRRFEPPVLVAASADPADRRVFVVDGVNVVLRGKIIASWRL